MKYKLDIKRDVDIAGEYTDHPDYILNLPHGFRFSDDLVHVRGYDSLKEIKEAIKTDVIPCDCADCCEGIASAADQVWQLQHGSK